MTLMTYCTKLQYVTMFLVAIFVICSLEENDEEETKSGSHSPNENASSSTKKSRSQFLEVLMNVKSTTHFVYLTSDILNQLGFPNERHMSAKG